MSVCNWPNCGIKIAPEYWTCAEHWRKLPDRLRSQIAATYKPGEPDTPEYIAAVEMVQVWWVSYEWGKRGER